jgi:pimeloyl-ACP methyl ester carboxylesterase
MMRAVRFLPLIGAFFAALMTSACTVTAAESDANRFPTSADYGPSVMERFSFTAGVAEGWQISGLRTLHPDAPYRVVVVSGTPSWSEYWAPVLAAAPATWEMIVVDRPGFAESQPEHAVTRLTDQAAALSPLLHVAPGRHVVLLGQSFGGPIATLMAAGASPEERPLGLVIVSGFFGDRGTTASRLYGLGGALQPLLPRDLRNAVSEVRHQPPQLPSAFAALDSLTIPVIVLHGEDDTFVPPSAAEALATRLGPRGELRMVPKGDHFLNACCVTDVIGAVESLIPTQTP